MGLNPPCDYNDDISNKKLHENIIDESQHLQECDIFPDQIIDLMDELGIVHPLKKLKDRPRFELGFIKSNMPEISRKKLVSREESVIRTLKRSWSTMEEWAIRSNQFYIENGGTNNMKQAIKATRIGIRYMEPAAFIETRGTCKNIEFRITTKFDKRQKGE